MKHPCPGRESFGWPLAELRQLGQGWVGSTYQYCPPESSRYISSEDSLRCSSLVGLGRGETLSKEQPNPELGEVGVLSESRGTSSPLGAGLLANSFAEVIISQRALGAY